MKENIFQMYELEAFLGEYIDDYDIDAIIDEATETSYKDGNRYWKVDADELSKIAARHDITGIDSEKI